LLGLVSNDRARNSRKEDERNSDRSPADAHENTLQPKSSLNSAGAKINTQWLTGPGSVFHQPPRFICQPLFGAPLPLRADIVAKVFWGGVLKFLEPLMRFARGDVRDYVG
jgi:hypothetical protein